MNTPEVVPEKIPYVKTLATLEAMALLELRLHIGQAIVEPNPALDRALMQKVRFIAGVQAQTILELKEKFDSYLVTKGVLQ